MGSPPPLRLGLLLTEQCNLVCGHCWFESGPEKLTTMSYFEAKKYIDMAVNTGSIKWISLTGGEPMLYPQLVEDLIAYSTDRGLKTELITNGFWGDMKYEAEKQLKSLRNAGLSLLNLSIDDFHQQFISFRSVKNCYEIGKQLGLHLAVMTVIGSDSKLRIRDVFDGLSDDFIYSWEENPEGRLTLGVETPFTPVGRGATLPIERRLVVGFTRSPCISVLSDIGVKPGGDLLPCCSAASLVTGMRLGNLNFAEIKQLIDLAWKRIEFRILREVGPIGLSDLECIGYTNPCHLCYEALISRYSL